MSQTANIINGSPNRTPTAPIAVIETDQTNSNTSAPAMNNRWSTSPASSMNSQNSSPPVVNNINHHHNGTNHSINISNFGYINFNYPIGTSNAVGAPKILRKAMAVITTLMQYKRSTKLVEKGRYKVSRSTVNE
jgi:hypothetical protein